MTGAWHRAAHLVVHYLDAVRHFCAFAWQPYGWVTNVSGGLVYAALAGVVAYVCWPRFRRLVDAWVQGHLHRHHTNIVAPHHLGVENSLSDLHRKLDQLLSHAPPTEEPRDRIP